MPSMRQPWLATLVSLAIRQRSSMFLSSRGSGRQVYHRGRIKPPEIPLHAIRPAMGLPKEVEIVAL